MRSLMHMKLSTRLILNSLLLSIVPIIIISVYSYRIAGIEVEKGVREELDVLHSMVTGEVNNYFHTIQKQIITLAENTMVISATKDFSEAFSRVETDLGKRYDTDLAANDGLLKARYVYQEANTPNGPKDAVSKWWPKDRVTRILQHYYIAANPYPAEDNGKRKLDFSADGSSYSQLHRGIHPILRSFVEKFEYQDIFLVDVNGRIVYSVQKQVDFATNLLTGPYNDSGLAKVFKGALESDTAGSIHFVDVAPHAPYFNKLVSFVASPILDGEIKVGVLVFQFGTSRLNALLTHDETWREIGLGETGETFLVGIDHIMRSESRRLLESLPAFIEHLKKNNFAEATIKAIEEHKTSINTLEFQSPVTDAALSGKNGITVAVDLDGDPAITAYGPISFGGVNWALLAIHEEGEAFAALYEMRTTILWISVLLAGLATLIGWLIARAISNPIAETVNILSSSSSEMAATTNQQERIANQQAASVNETNTTMEELSISSKQSAQQAQIASDSTHNVLALAEEGGHQVQEMLNGMEGLRDKVTAIAQQILKLSEQTSQIGTITGVMTDFANETKMLAMNAAVEAVRAGEHGRGFSVLSVEIRKLAEESKRSAERINALVLDVQKATNATVMATEEGTKTVEKTIGLAHTTASSFNSVSESMHTVSTSAQQISLNIKQQAEAVRQVVVAMNELKTGAREGAAGISQTKEGIKLLNEAAQKLKAMV